jgi:alpha-tubulin suppressor-like RCC1 family protein
MIVWVSHLNSLSTGKLARRETSIVFRALYLADPSSCLLHVLIPLEGSTRSRQHQKHSLPCPQCLLVVFSHHFACACWHSVCLQVAAGLYTSGAVGDDGRAWTWGSGSWHQLGHGSGGGGGGEQSRLLAPSSEVAPRQARAMVIASDGQFSQSATENDSQAGDERTYTLTLSTHS